jgi:hypothetical protein
LIATKNKRKETIMMILRQFSAELSTIPTITSWYLADLSKAQGNNHQMKRLMWRSLLSSLAKKVKNKIGEIWGE